MKCPRVRLRDFEKNSLPKMILFAGLLLLCSCSDSGKFVGTINSKPVSLKIVSAADGGSFSFADTKHGMMVYIGSHCDDEVKKVKPRGAIMPLFLDSFELKKEFPGTKILTSDQSELRLFSISIRGDEQVYDLTNNPNSFLSYSYTCEGIFLGLRIHGKLNGIFHDEKGRSVSVNGTIQASLRLMEYNFR